MNSSLRVFLNDLHTAGAAHDAAEPNRLLKYRNLEPETAGLLGLVIRMAGARRVVEIGTSNGYSTVVLADAVSDTDGRVVTVDTAPSDDARANLARADAAQPGLVSRVEFRQQDGGAYLKTLADGSVDLLFLDSERPEYPGWWPHPLRVLRRGGVLAIDNVLAHPDEVALFLALLARETGLVQSTFPIGKGLHLAWLRHATSNSEL